MFRRLFRHSAKMVTELSDVPTVSDLYAAGKLSPASSPAKGVTGSSSINGRVSVLRGDITKLKVDAIVNAANSSLLGGGGVDGAIHRAAGLGLVRECEPLGGCHTGDAKMTDGYELPASKVIHAVGPIYFVDKEEAPALLGNCYRKSMRLCAGAGLKSIGFSAISTGVYGYPSGEAAEVACRVVREELEGKECEGIERVVFLTFEMKDVRAYNETLPKFFPPEDAKDEGDAKSTEEAQDTKETEEAKEVKETKEASEV